MCPQAHVTVRRRRSRSSRDRQVGGPQPLRAYWNGRRTRGEPISGRYLSIGADPTHSIAMSSFPSPSYYSMWLCQSHTGSVIHKLVGLRSPR